MITADLHSHTRYSHGASTPQEMYAAACTAGLKLLGFTEHSPRPLGFDYTNEYREQLSRFMPTYAREVCELRDNAAPDACQVLFGMEMDWLEECVEGELPSYDELDAKTRSLLNVNGLDIVKGTPQ